MTRKVTDLLVQLEQQAPMVRPALCTAWCDPSYCIHPDELPIEREGQSQYVLMERFHCVLPLNRGLPPKGVLACR